MIEKDNVFDYVLNSPENTNPSVLLSLLNLIPEADAPQNFVVEIEPDEQGGYESNKSFEELVDAYNAGKNIEAIVSLGQIYGHFFINQLDTEESNITAFIFQGALWGAISDDYYVVYFSITEDGVDLTIEPVVVAMFLGRGLNGQKSE